MSYIFNLLKHGKVTRVSNAAVAATSDIDSSRVDMSGFDSVCFIALLGDVTSGSVLELQGKVNTADSTSGATEVTDGTVTYTAGASDADNKLMILDIRRPNRAVTPYAYCTLLRGTQNAVVDGIIAIRYNARDVPTSQDSTVLASAVLQVA